MLVIYIYIYKDTLGLLYVHVWSGSTRAV
jgi:hypothetical protein